MSKADENTFLFADLAGYTALTEAHGDEQAADLAAGFFDAVRALLPEHQAEEVKLIGDAVMLRCSDAGAAIRLALQVVHDVGARHGFPGVRVGMHTGSAVMRDGDWFGTTVNVAARVADAAAGGEVLVTDATRRAPGETSGVELHPRGRRELKNVTEPVQIYAAVRAGEETAEGLPLDPVCRMAVDPAHAAGTLIHAGTEYHFCSLACVEAFAAHAERYARD